MDSSTSILSLFMAFSIETRASVATWWPKPLEPQWIISTTWIAKDATDDCPVESTIPDQFLQFPSCSLQICHKSHQPPRNGKSMQSWSSTTPMTVRQILNLNLCIVVSCTKGAQLGQPSFLCSAWHHTGVGIQHPDHWVITRMEYFHRKYSGGNFSINKFQGDETCHTLHSALYLLPNSNPLCIRESLAKDIKKERILPQAPVHPHLQCLLQVLGTHRDDSLATNPYLWFQGFEQTFKFCSYILLTGMWSKRDCASCSFTGCTSFSLKFVLRRRTCNRRTNQRLYHLPSISSSQPELIWELLPENNLYLIDCERFLLYPTVDVKSNTSRAHNRFGVIHVECSHISCETQNMDLDNLTRIHYKTYVS